MRETILAFFCIREAFCNSSTQSISLLDSRDWYETHSTRMENTETKSSSVKDKPVEKKRKGQKPWRSHDAKPSVLARVSWWMHYTALHILFRHAYSMHTESSDYLRTNFPNELENDKGSAKISATCIVRETIQHRLYHTNRQRGAKRG